MDSSTRENASTYKSFFISLAEDFTAGTARISAITGFLNLTVILSVWQERIGLPAITLFGSSFVVYAVIILIIGHYDRRVQEKLLKNIEDDGR